MSNIQRQAIVTIGAIVGVQLVNVVLSPAQPGQTSNTCLKWASDAIDGYAYNWQRSFNRPKVPEGLTEGEYNQYREIFKTDDIRVAPAPVGVPQAVAPATIVTPQPVAGTQTTPLPPPATVAPVAAPSPSKTVLDTGLTEAEYQAKRRSMLVPLATPNQTASSCSWYKGKKYCGEG